MKKYLLGIFAIVLAIGFSAFTNITPKAKKTDPFWFQISGAHMPSDPVPQADAVFIQQSPLPPNGTGCSGTTYDCVAGFNATQINASNQLKDNLEVPGTVPKKKL